MTTRIVLALLAFTAAVLVGAVVPLTLNATGHDRNSYIQATAGMAVADAAIAQARLDGLSDLPLLDLFQQTQEQGNGLLILSSTLNGNAYQQTPDHNRGMPPGNWDALASYVDQEATSAERPAGQHPPQAPQAPVKTQTVGSWVIAATAVYARGGPGPVVGTVILARSTQSLDGEFLGLWLILGTISALAMIAAALLAFGLARWVSRPLKGLDAAARRLADGDLAIRTVVGTGPPELRRLGTTFNTMAGRLEALVHGNRAVIADVSHQLRTPLAALRLRLDLLAAEAAQSDPATGHELAAALDELARLSRLVDGLLAVARAENVVPVPVAVDVAEVARERVAAWHPLADDRNIVLTAAPAGGGGGSGSADAPVLAWIGEGHLEQILDNLIANALEALTPGQRVTVITAATQTGARIAVRDHGRGMSPEDRERAFLRFGTSSPNGTGLGLAIVHRLTTSNGGTARLDQTSGGGLTVTLDFPGVPASNGGAHYGSPDSRLSSSGGPDNAVVPTSSGV
jgi:signal transduction histidine kinase